jgi:hypothetical protein
VENLANASNEDEFEGALLALLKHIDAAIDDLIGLASNLDELLPSAAFTGVQLCRRNVDAAEALLATIAHRGGLTWDVMAQHYNVSKQAHHHRLKVRGEQLWAEAQEQPRKLSALDVLDDEVAAEIAALGARELNRRAAHPYAWSSRSVNRPDIHTRTQLSKAAELYLAGNRSWPSIVRRPDDT